jgi:large subunit ribosomal protein L4
MSTAVEPTTFAGSRHRLGEAVVVERRSAGGEVLGRLRLDPEYFSVPVNVPLLHQVVTAQLAARRAGTQSTKTRAEVAGGSKKPYRQKGTGNARQGSIRAPHYAGGGIALGPKPRSYAQKTPVKMVRQALRCALSDRAASGAVVVVDEWPFEVPRTRDAKGALVALGLGESSVLVVLERGEDVAARSFANLPGVSCVPADQLTAYDVLSADVVVFDDATLPGEASATDEVATAASAAASPAPAAGGGATAPAARRSTGRRAAVAPEQGTVEAEMVTGPNVDAGAAPSAARGARAAAGESGDGGDGASAAAGEAEAGEAEAGEVEAGEVEAAGNEDGEEA